MAAILNDIKDSGIDVLGVVVLIPEHPAFAHVAQFLERSAGMRQTNRILVTPEDDPTGMFALASGEAECPLAVFTIAINDIP